MGKSRHAIYALALYAITASAQTPPQEEAPMPLDTPSEHAHTNRLIDETSPYLLQHAHNPVDWYPWGDEAIEKARTENKPIFLSIGYSACHWCHVMEHESFENEAIAAILNEHFISIKVDREERPDLDDIYMGAVQAMTGQGGWPMTVFLTPDLKPFYGGTYYPPEDKFGRPGFGSLTTQIAKIWETEPQKLLESADQLTNVLSANAGFQGESADAITDEPFPTVLTQLQRDYDLEDGGWGAAPKFPSGPTIDLLLRRYHATKNEAALGMALDTLRKMANGGMYDHLGGGFHRYSVDAQWLVPHFEKMLYDNAQLIPVYLDAYQITKDPFFKRVAVESLDYVLTYMTGEEGAFYSTEDADSEGEEGKFYIWTSAELTNILGPDDVKLFNAYYSILPNGNFQSHEPYHAGQNIPHVTEDLAVVAKKFDMTGEAFQAKLDTMRAKLLEVRDKRVRPGRDDKIITAWNGLMIAAMAQGYAVLGDTRYRDAAAKSADFILKSMRADTGMLYRTYRMGQAKHLGYLDDHANLAAGLTDLFAATGDPHWIEAATDIADTMLREYADTEGPGFYTTSDEHTHLITREKSSYDGSEPSGNSMAIWALLRLARYTDNESYYDTATETIRANFETLRKHPRALTMMLVALDFALAPPREIVIAGHENADDTNALLKTVADHYLPNTIVARTTGNDVPSSVPLLSMKGMTGEKATAYVCENYACQRPVTTAEELAAQLAPVKGNE